MSNMDDDFLGFLFFESTNCPKCGQLVTRDEVKENLDGDGEFFTCPYCQVKTKVSELR